MCTKHQYTLLSVYTQERVEKFVSPRQRGTTLVEMLIAMLLSLIVSVSAVLMLRNSLGNNSQLMNYALLSNELRKSMQLMTRDVRRAGYTAGAQWCLANTLCLPSTTINLPEPLGFLDPLPLIESIELPQGIQVAEGGQCFVFELDRDQNATINDGDYGGYRRVESSGVGVLMAWMGQNAPTCNGSLDSWAVITNSAVIDINGFVVDDSQSFDEVVSTDLLGNSTSQRIRRIRLELSGQLVSDSAVNETIETTVDVRNDVLM
jgi:type II secretory pathway pseudopilin PulG